MFPRKTQFGGAIGHGTFLVFVRRPSLVTTNNLECTIWPNTNSPNVMTASFLALSPPVLCSALRTESPCVQKSKQLGARTRVRQTKGDSTTSPCTINGSIAGKAGARSAKEVLAFRMRVRTESRVDDLECQSKNPRQLAAVKAHQPQREDGRCATDIMVSCTNSNVSQKILPRYSPRKPSIFEVLIR